MKIPKLPAGEIARRAVQSKHSIKSEETAWKKSIKTKRVIQQAFGVTKTQLPQPALEDGEQSLTLGEDEQPGRPEHGEQIFVFNHLQRNHVVYSLTRAMNNNAALAQIPFNGKKSVPAALRKDLWQPFAHIKFPPGTSEIGLSVFQKLREYRKRHELEWGDEVLLDKDGKLRAKIDKAKAICDQKANSVADMAAVLNRLAAPAGRAAAEWKGKEEKSSNTPRHAAAEKAKRTRAMKKNTLPGELNIGLIGEATGTKVEILWGNMHDAEFAEKWAENVEQAPMPAPPRPGSKRKIQKREIVELRAGQHAAMREFAEAQRERKAQADSERDAADPQWRSKMTVEEQEAEYEKEATEYAAELEKIEEEFKTNEQRQYYKAQRAAEAASKFAQRLANGPEKIVADLAAAPSSSPSTFEARAKARAQAKYSKPTEEALRKLAPGAMRKLAPTKASSPAKTKVVFRKPEAEKKKADAVLKLAKQAKEQAARDLYERRMAERAQKIASDPAWYEKVKSDGAKRAAEKNLA